MLTHLASVSLSAAGRGGQTPRCPEAPGNLLVFLFADANPPPPPLPPAPTSPGGPEEPEHREPEMRPEEEAASSPWSGPGKCACSRVRQRHLTGRPWGPASGGS